MDQNGSPVDLEGGNTNSPSRPVKKRQGLAKRHCFTLNNYSDIDIRAICINFKGLDWCMAEEVGEEGTPHLQGYVEHRRRCRPIEKYGLNKSIHWEKAKKNREVNVDYCNKENGKKYGNLVPRKIKTIEVLYDWQQEIVDIITKEPDERKIYWYYDKKGNKGKSAIVKYLCVHHNAIVLGGKAADMKYAIQQQVIKNGWGS